ncbi:MAG: neutral/alkaline non-lysosomal ceramidase N-terminal domain-containing protein [Cyclobacteriaceae bacterium]|nr:neutral/alkaline non-lysosomal ceramidase N-terminal domain-containing protein [Cyclobacteriaceae bacterium]
MKMSWIVIVMLASVFSALNNRALASDIWKAGMAKRIITPEQPLWMAGYAHRNRPGDSKLHDLWARALFLEDASGRQGLFIGCDILGFPKIMSDRIRDSLKAVLGLERAQIILHGTHTHSGPVLSNALTDIYPLEARDKKPIDAYSEQLIYNLIDLAIEAKARIEPVRLFSGNGVVRFQVNRRQNREADIHTLTELKGPHDYAVPVLDIRDVNGDRKAIMFGYACHPTTLDLYQWSGDYPGFAQIELEKMYPGLMTFFFQGASGDLNPLPRRSIALAKQYGKELAAAVEAVIHGELNPLSSAFKVAYQEISLQFSAPAKISELQKLSKEAKGYEQKWAINQLEELQQGKQPPTEYVYPIQLWALGEQLIFSLGGEVLVEYALQIKQIFGRGVFVMAYSNDVMGYIPTEKVLKEGGYEGDSSQKVYGLPSVWKSGLQAQILNATTNLTNLAGYNTTHSKQENLEKVLQSILD